MALAISQLVTDCYRGTWPTVVYIGSGTNESPDPPINEEGQRDTRILREAIPAAFGRTRE